MSDPEGQGGAPVDRRDANAAGAAPVTPTPAPPKRPPLGKEEKEARRARREARQARQREDMRARETTGIASAKPRVAIEQIYRDDDLAISRMGAADASRVVLCFAGIGAGRQNRVDGEASALGGIQPAEFVGSSLIEDASVLHIADIKRSWFNGFAPDRLLDVIRPLIWDKRVITLGNSMGGFGAIWITRFLPVDVAMAFVPQFSVHPEVVPAENRWRRWTRRIDEWRTISLADSFVPETRYYTFNGGRDHLHWSHFRKQDNARHFLVDRAGHNAAERIKNAGALNDVIRACVAGGDPEPPMRARGLDVREIGA